MSKKPLVSVVTPVYNVEKYLPECIESVLNQTLQNVEIICVDDKSPDNCGKILDDYAAKDPRVKVFHHEENLGMAAARNTAFKHIKGEFVYFLDSDDVLPPNALESMYNKAKKTNSDVVIGDVITFSEFKNENIEFDNKKSGDVFNKAFSVLPESFHIDDVYKLDDYDFMYSSLYFMVVWMKLFNAKLFKENEISAPSLRCAEDFMMVKKLFHLAKKITTVDDVVIYYRKRPDSFTTTRKPHVFDMFKSYEPAIKMFSEIGYLEQEYTNIHRFYLNSYIYHLIYFTPYKLWGKFFWKTHKEVQKWDLSKIDKELLTEKELRRLNLYSMRNNTLFFVKTSVKLVLLFIDKIFLRKALKLVACLIPNKKARHITRSLLINQMRSL